MLQQILKTMWINPELLEHLDENQKQTLFCKMREEQVRRWKEWEKKETQINVNNIRTNNNNKPKKSVNFLLGNDGEPWTWIMGEHSNDKTIEEILSVEARQKARKLVEELSENQDLLEMNEKNIKETVIEEPKIIDNNCDIYCSVEELREKAKLEPIKIINNYSFNHYKTDGIYNMNNTRDVLQEITFNAPHKVAHKVALWEKKMMEERIFKKIQKKQQEVAKEAEEAEHKQQALWIEQERRAKEAEQQIREIARKAREEHRLACQKEEVLQNETKSSPTPPNRQAVLEWYRNKEVYRKAGIDQTNNIEPWFHGLITRQEAESLLLHRENGSFLVRLSEKIWGYAITYKVTDKCKHYLIDGSNNHYQFVGNNQMIHNNLGDLISYHHKQPLWSGECLVYPCPRNPNSTATLEIMEILSR